MEKQPTGLESKPDKGDETNLSENQKEKEPNLIDTTKDPKKVYVENTRLTMRMILHDKSLGIIEWDREKYKDALHFVPKQLAGDGITGRELEAEVRTIEKPLLNATVLEYLLDNQDQIPEEWKQVGVVYFWGTKYHSDTWRTLDEEGGGDDFVLGMGFVGGENKERTYWHRTRKTLDDYSSTDKGAAACFVK